MFRIDWLDKVDDRQKSLKVHSFKSVSIVTEALRRDSYRYAEIKVTKLQPTRVREVVIVVGN
jgi:hypothetical protein